MEPTRQQLQPAADALPARSAAAAPPQREQSQPTGYRRWIAAVLAVFAVAAVAVAVTHFTEPAVKQTTPENLDVELDPIEILRQQFQVYRPRPQRLKLHISFGRVLFDEGRFAEAAVQFEEAYKLAATSPEFAETQRLWGLSRLRQGRLQSARDILEEALNAWHEETDMFVLHTLAEANMEMGRFAVANKWYNQAFSLADKRQDADSAALFAADMGELWLRQGKLQESLHWLTTAGKALTSSRVSPAGSLDVVQAKVDSLHGFVHHRAGDISLAANLYRKAFRAQTRALRPGHQDLVSTQLGLARALRDSGDVRGAIHDVEGVEKTLRGGAREGPNLGRVLVFKADLLREANHTAVATEVIQEAISLHESAFQGEDHPDMATALSSYGSILQDAGMAEAAQERYKEALAISLRTVGDKHPGTAMAYNSLGTLYEDLGDDKTATENFGKCLEIQLETLGKDSPDVANTYNNLATVLFRQGKQPEAKRMLQDAIQVLDSAGVPHDNPDRALYQENLDLVLVQDVALQSSA